MCYNILKMNLIKILETGGVKVKVLIVDDAPTTRKLIKHILEQDGRFDIVGEAKNGDEAIELAKSVQPDIITLDLIMPIKGGVDAAKEILETAKGARILFVTSIKDKSIEEQAKTMGIDYILQKPFTPKELIEALNKIIGEIENG